jgi:hypothetical protein
MQVIFANEEIFSTHDKTAFAVLVDASAQDSLQQMSYALTVG